MIIQRRLIFIIGTIFFIIIAFYVYDLLYGQKKEPSFYNAFGPFCSSYWSAITLPPVGIFICPNDFNNEGLRRHELVHWGQYQRMSTLGFYARYLMGWAGAGFSYSENWMEEEASAVTN